MAVAGAFYFMFRVQGMSNIEFYGSQAAKDRANAFRNPPPRNNKARLPKLNGPLQPSFDFESAICHQAGAAINDIVRARATIDRDGGSLAGALIASGRLEPGAYTKIIAKTCGFSLCDRPPLREFKVSAVWREPCRMLRHLQPVPLKYGPHKVLLCADTLPASALRALAGSLGASAAKIGLTTRRALTAAVNKAHSRFFLHRAVSGLAEKYPEQSAADGLWLWQTLLLAAAAGFFAGAAIFMPRETLLTLCAFFSILFLLTITIRAAAAIHMLIPGRKRRPTRQPSRRDLPCYSVLVPLFREARVLSSLLAALRRIDYPVEKLDIKLILEEADQETLAAVRRQALPGNIDVIVVPDCEPRTKPKALNYALQFATGDLAVIFDAEDRPEPDQLLKAAHAFAAAPPGVVCLQARLAFYNAHENWLSRQFAIEYASLFEGILPMLDTLRLPIPLGGTSNHFRIEALRALGGWDAFNVTEDADLGMRLYRAGWRCETLPSNTYEEAACQPGNWLRQRSRWLKGWMQTYAVHMRRPGGLRRSLGLAGFLAFHGQFAGMILSALVHPLFYLLLIYDYTQGKLFEQSGGVLANSLLAISIVNLLTGYAASFVLGATVLASKRMYWLTPQLVFIPLYWLMISLAAYRALYQFIVKPFHWDKTEHGLSRFAPMGDDRNAKAAKPRRRAKGRVSVIR